MKAGEIKLLRITSAAKMIGVTRQTIHKHIKRGALPTIDIDGTKFVNRDDVLILYAKNQDMRERRNPHLPQAGTEVAGAVGAVGAAD